MTLAGGLYIYNSSMTASRKQHGDVATQNEPRSSWVSRGACAIATEVFMREPLDVAGCKSICKHCPVIGLCLDYAIANDERFGVWGGLDRKERKAVKAQRDVSNVPLEFRDHYLKVEGRVKRNHPTPRYVRNPNLDLVIDPEFLEFLNQWAA